MFKRKKTAQPPAQRTDPEAIFGADLTAKLVTTLGPEGLAEFADWFVAETGRLWNDRHRAGLLTDEERTLLTRRAGEQVVAQGGQFTIKMAAAIFTIAEAEKIAWKVSTDAVEKANLDPELRPELEEPVKRILGQSK